MYGVQGNRIVMLDIDTNGQIEERIPGTGQESWLDCTLLGAMYPKIRVALVSVPTEPLDDFEEAQVANTMTSVFHDGVLHTDPIPLDNGGHVGSRRRVWEESEVKNSRGADDVEDTD